MRVRHIAAALAAITAFGVTPAFADDPPGQPGAWTDVDDPPSVDADKKAKAKELFKEGRAAFKERNFTLALQRFQQSEALYSAPGTRLNLALTLKELGKQAEALAALDALIASLAEDDKRRAIAVQTRETMAKYVPRLKIQLEKDAPDGVVIELDGLALAPAQVGVERRINPGNHSVVVRAPFREPRRYDVRLEPGSNELLTVNAGKVVSQKAPPVPPPPPLPPPVQIIKQAPSAGPMFYAGIASLAVGGAGLIVGGLTGGLALGKKSDLDARCPRPAECDAVGLDIAAEGQTLSVVSTVGFAVGAVGAGVGLTLILLDDPESSDEVTAGPTAGGGALRWTRRF